MKESALLLAGLLLAAGTRAAGDSAATAGPAAAALLTPTAQASTQDLERAEALFQQARRRYLAGERGAAMNDLNQSLALDAAHSGSARLLEAIRAEERSLRQVRLAPEPTPQPTREDASGSRRLWNSLMNMEARLEKRLGSLERGLTEDEGRLNTLRAELEGQREVMDLIKKGQERGERRTDQVWIALFILAGLLVLLLLVLLRWQFKLKNELEDVEARLAAGKGRRF